VSYIYSILIFSSTGTEPAFCPGPLGPLVLVLEPGLCKKVYSAPSMIQTHDLLPRVKGPYHPTYTTLVAFHVMPSF